MLIAHRRKSLKPVSRGQSLAEFALSSVFLITLLSGLLDLGRLFFVFVALEDAAGEGALYLSFNPRCRTSTDDGGGTLCDAPNNADYRIRHSGGGLVDWDAPGAIAITFKYVDNTSPPAGYAGADIYPNYELQDSIIVTITYQFELLTPVIPQIVGADYLPLTVLASHFVIEK